MRRWVRGALPVAQLAPLPGLRFATDGEAPSDLKLPFAAPFYDGPASHFVASVLAKPQWNIKITKDAITSKWCKEFAQEAAAKNWFDAITAQRVAAAAVLSLRRNARILAANDDAFTVEDRHSPDCKARPLPGSVDLLASDLAIKCQCRCEMCTEGNFAGLDPDVIDFAFGGGVGGTAEQQAECECFQGYKEKLRRLREKYLHDHIEIDTSLITADVAARVTNLFERLEKVPHPDWHPGSRDMMQDLIHPSMGCYVSGLHGGDLSDGANDSDASVFRWLPADIRLGTDGTVTEVLGRGFQGCPDAAAQDVLVQVLNRMLAGMERVIAAAEPTISEHATPLRDRTIQVIAKLASCRLTPDKPSFPQGSWHLEGVAEEQIIATGIYYPPAPNNNVGPSSLAFRIGGCDDPCAYEYPQCGYDYVKVHFGVDVMDWRDRSDTVFKASCDLGSVETTPGTVLIFPNNFQHRVSSYALRDPTVEGRRRIMLFWLVAPGTRVPSTVDVPDPTLNGMVKAEEAKAYRELLMLERKFVVTTQDVVYERLVTLCEH